MKDLRKNERGDSQFEGDLNNTGISTKWLLLLRPSNPATNRRKLLNKPQIALLANSDYCRLAGYII